MPIFGVATWPFSRSGSCRWALHAGRRRLRSKAPRPGWGWGWYGRCAITDISMTSHAQSRRTFVNHVTPLSACSGRGRARSFPADSSLTADRQDHGGLGPRSPAHLSRTRATPLGQAIRRPGSDARLGSRPSREPAPGPTSALPRRDGGGPPGRGVMGPIAAAPLTCPASPAHLSRTRATPLGQAIRRPGSDARLALGHRGSQRRGQLPRSRAATGGVPPRPGGDGTHRRWVPRHSERPPDQIRNQWLSLTESQNTKSGI